MKRKKLVIISHTEHYLDSNSVIRGWGPTVNEINFLSNHWDEICHVGCLYNEPAPASSLPYTSSNFTFISIPPYGGKKIIDKILIFFKIPKIIFKTLKAMKGASEIQLRLPTSMGLFFLPLFSIFIPRKFTFWVKYAGNWNHKQAPLSYKLQRWWLLNNWAKCHVTINGFWDDQPKHCLSFENPCLTDLDIQEGKKAILSKTYEKPFVFVFLGRLEQEKGVERIIDALRDIPQEIIAKVHFIGDGPNKKKYKESSSFLSDKVIFHGFQTKERVMELLKESHFLLLPSDSEGFPKVIAEGACYGVIPIVSDVGSISHYINTSNGFLWNLTGSASYSTIVQKAVNTSVDLLYAKRLKLYSIAESFTMESYKCKLENEILQNFVFNDRKFSNIN